MQLPIKDNIIFKFTDFKQSVSEGPSKLQPKETTAVADQNNPIISQVVFFAKMFDKFIAEDLKKSPEELNKILVDSEIKIDNDSHEKDYTNTENLKNIIYKTYSKSIDVAKKNQNKEKKKMKKIMNLLIYLQMKKIEMKLNYFNDFEKLIQFEYQQVKSMESQIIQDRIKLAIKKAEILNMGNKIKDGVKSSVTPYQSNGPNQLYKNLSDLNEKIKIEDEPRILDLN